MKKMKKVIALLIGSAMLLTACGQNGGSVVDSNVDLSSYPIETEETLTYWSNLPVNISISVDNFGSTEFARELGERTGVTIEYIHPAAGMSSEALNLMVSSNDLPDIIEYSWDSYPGGPIKALDEEVIIPLDDYKEYAPAFFNFLKEHPEYDRPSQTDSGEHYAFVNIMDGDKLLMVSGPAVRMDWLRELGLSVPKTIDDWTNMLTAFKEKKGIESPMSFSYGNVCLFFNMFESSIDPYVDGDVVKYGAIQPEFKEALITIREWFDKGLLDKNLVSVDTKIIDNQVLNDKTGALVTSGGGGIGQYMKIGVQNNPDFDLSAVPYPTRDGSPSSWLPVTNNVNAYGAAITTQCKSPKLAAKFLDYFYTEEGHILSNFGVEGVSFEMVDNYPTYTDLIMNNPDGLTISQALGLYVKAGTTGPFVCDEKYIEQYYGLPQQKAALENWTIDVDKSKLRDMPTISTTTEENAEYARIMNEITKYRDQMIVKFINGIEPIENFDKYVDTMKQLGVDRAMEIQTAALKRYNNR